MKLPERDLWDKSPIDAQLASPPTTYEPRDHNDAPTPATPLTDLIQNRGAVLGVLFLATGALGLPLLWMNKKFSNAERIGWGIVVTIYTILLIAGFCWIMLWSYRRIRGL